MRVHFISALEKYRQRLFTASQVVACIALVSHELANCVKCTGGAAVTICQRTAPSECYPK